MIVVPIVAAHGLAMPKASSRAITSAAGTADAMETVARVDLDIHDVRKVIDAARGCIVWNGKLNHSALDDVMNSITRPLKLDSVKWSVASILSKKVSAGVTHVVVDLPYGPFAKLKTEQQANEDRRSAAYRRRGAGADRRGASVARRSADRPGHRPRIWRCATSWRCSKAAPDAPDDLRDKALTFASRILRWAPGIVSEAAAKSRAEHLLGSGAARSAFDRIIDAQGRRAPAAVRVRLLPKFRPRIRRRCIDKRLADRGDRANDRRAVGFRRRAGASRAYRGEQVREGDSLYTIRSNSPKALAAAAAAAASDNGFEIA